MISNAYERLFDGEDEWNLIFGVYERLFDREDELRWRRKKVNMIGIRKKNEKIII